MEEFAPATADPPILAGQPLEGPVFEGHVAAIAGVPLAAVQSAARVGVELPLDSLQKLELVTWLQTVGADIDGDQLTDGVTVGELHARFLEATQAGELPEQLPPPPADRGPRRRGADLSLIPIAPAALPFLYDLAVGEQAGYRWRFRGAVPSPEMFEAGLWQGVLAQFLVVSSADGSPAGHVVAYNADVGNGYAHLGAIFAAEYVGTGQPIEAVSLFIDYLFTTWDLRKLYMELPEFNLAPVESGAGKHFRIEGRLVEHEYYDGRYWDKIILALYRADWRARQR